MPAAALALLGLLVALVAGTLVVATIAVAAGDAPELGRVIEGWRTRR